MGLTKKILDLTEKHFFSVLESVLKNTAGPVRDSFDAVFTQEIPSEFGEYASGTRLLLVMALSLLKSNSIENIDDMATQLAEYAKINYPLLTPSEVIKSFKLICDLSDIIVEVENEKFIFSNAYAKGYTWLHAAKFCGQEFLINYLTKKRR